jgi:hypothetical protein
MIDNKSRRNREMEESQSRKRVIQLPPPGKLLALLLLNVIEGERVLLQRDSSILETLYKKILEDLQDLVIHVSMHSDLCGPRLMLTMIVWRTNPLEEQMETYNEIFNTDEYIENTKVMLNNKNV